MMNVMLDGCPTNNPRDHLLMKTSLYLSHCFLHHHGAELDARGYEAHKLGTSTHVTIYGDICLPTSNDDAIAICERIKEQIFADTVTDFIGLIYLYDSHGNRDDAKVVTAYTRIIRNTE